MRKAKPPLVLVLLAALCAAVAGCGGSAACASGPLKLEASPAEAAPGETFGLRGEGFYGDFVCNDSGPAVLSRPAGGRPTDGIRIEFLQNGRTWTLATVASDKNLRFDARGLAVPPHAEPGKALVRATSPSTSRGIRPPQDDAPILVLEDLPETEGPGLAPGR